MYSACCSDGRAIWGEGGEVLGSGPTAPRGPPCTTKTKPALCEKPVCQNWVQDSKVGEESAALYCMADAITAMYARCMATWTFHIVARKMPPARAFMMMSAPMGRAVKK